jgi:hypothetical protein
MPPPSAAPGLRYPSRYGLLGVTSRTSLLRSGEEVKGIGRGCLQERARLTAAHEA